MGACAKQRGCSACHCSQVWGTSGYKLIHDSLNFPTGTGVYVLRRTSDTAILNGARERHIPPTHPQHRHIASLSVTAVLELERGSNLPYRRHG